MGRPSSPTYSEEEEVHKGLVIRLPCYLSALEGHNGTVWWHSLINSLFTWFKLLVQLVH